MILDNKEIEDKVRLFADHACANSPPEDEGTIRSAAILLCNFLQCINDIAFCAVNKDQRESSQ